MRARHSRERKRLDALTAPASDPVAVWKQFCSEANLTHQGAMSAPPAFQKDLIP